MTDNYETWIRVFPHDRMWRYTSPLPRQSVARYSQTKHRRRIWCEVKLRLVFIILCSLLCFLFQWREHDQPKICAVP